MSGSTRGSLLRGIGAAVGKGAPYFAAGVATVDAANLYDRSRQLAGMFQNPNLLFPSDLRTGDVPFMSMQFSEYKRRSIYEQPFYETKMKISLPIPENLVEQIGLQYNKGEELGSVAGSVMEGLSGGPNASTASTIAAGAGVASAQALAGGAISASLRNLGVANSSASSAGAAVTSQAANILSAVTGITTNPFQTVLFKAPHFRTHRFSWRLVPKSYDESERLREIIETFRFHSLPGISAAGGVFFSYPEILEVNFRPSDKFLYKFKPCVVESISINYAPNNPSFNRSSLAPTAVQFSINLQEIEIWTKADYLRNQQGGLGNQLITDRFRDALTTLERLDAPFRQDARAGTNPGIPPRTQ